MAETKFKVKYIESYLAEIFGNQRVPNPLLLKNLSQKTKYNLKKLGNALQKEYKEVQTTLQEIFGKYSEEVPEEVMAEVVEASETATGEPKEGEEVKKEAPKPAKKAPSKPPQRRVIEEKKEEFLKEVTEIEDMDVIVDHYPFIEKDFVDKETGEIVSDTAYYNVIDCLLWDSEVEEEADAVAKK